MAEFPTYPEEYSFPPNIRTSLNVGLYGWLFNLSKRNPDLSRADLAALATDRLLETWFLVPWPSERIGHLALLVALLWLVGAGTARALA